MSLLDETSIFATVVHEGGFSHAAKKLGLSNGLISRKIKSLEERLGVSLLIRTTRSLELTTEGKLYLQHAERIQRELETGMTLLSAATDKAQGHIRLSAPVYFARYLLTPIICDFMREFPEISVEILATNTILDPIEHHIDLLFRSRGFTVSSAHEDEHLKGRYLIDYAIGTYASPEYLLKHSEPLKPEDLKNHRVIGYSSLNDHTPEIWSYSYKNKSSEIELQPIFQTDDVESNIEACKAGIGIARFSQLSIQAEDSGKSLRRILSNYCWGKGKLYALYPHQAGLPKRVRLLLDYIIARLPKSF